MTIRTLSTKRTKKIPEPLIQVYYKLMYSNIYILFIIRKMINVNPSRWIIHHLNLLNESILLIFQVNYI
jgi:hypothetical protein